jgi:hypothetical protein
MARYVAFPSISDIIPLPQFKDNDVIFLRLPKPDNLPKKRTWLTMALRCIDNLIQTKNRNSPQFTWNELWEYSKDTFKAKYPDAQTPEASLRTQLLYLARDDFLRQYIKKNEVEQVAPIPALEPMSPAPKIHESPQVIALRQEIAKLKTIHMSMNEIILSLQIENNAYKSTILKNQTDELQKRLEISKKRPRINA